MTQLFDPGRQASQESSFACGRDRGGEIAEQGWLVCLAAQLSADFALVRLRRSPLRWLADGHVESQADTNRPSAPEKGLAPIFSRQYSVSYCGFSNWLMPMPTSNESVAVQGRGL